MSSDAREVDGVLIAQSFHEDGHEMSEVHREDRIRRIQGSSGPERRKLCPVDARIAKLSVRNGGRGRRRLHAAGRKETVNETIIKLQETFDALNQIIKQKIDFHKT